MATAAAGQQVTDPDGDKAAAIKRRIDAGQQPTDEDLARYLQAIGEASAAASHTADADAFTRWAAEQGRLATLAGVQPVPGPEASLEERRAYIDAATRAGQAPDEATVTAYLAQVDQANAEATAELERRYPPGFFDDGRPKTPTEEELRGELHDPYQRQLQDPASVAPDEWATLQARLGLLVDQAATDARSREFPWGLPADAGNDPGASPEAVQALTTPGLWTPREPTETEHTPAELGQLEEQAAAINQGDDAA
jgi:hypothetical protein